MFKSLSFLWKYAWKVDKGYLFCLIFYQVFFSVTPILIMIFPKVLIDELMGRNDLTTLMVLVVGFSLTIFLSQSVSSILKNAAFYRRCIVLEQFQMDLNEHLANVDFENLEDVKFLNLKQNAEKFLYANGQGFSFVLDRAMNIVGKLILFVTIMWIIASLNWMVLIAFLLLSVLNSYAQMKFKKTYAQIEMDKNPKERELSYFNNLFADIRYGKEIRVNGDKTLFLDYLRNILHNLWGFYKKQMHLLNRSKLFLYFVDFTQRFISYVYMIFMVSNGTITIGSFTMYINAIATFTSSMNDVIDSVNDIRQYSLYFEAVEEYLHLPIRISREKLNAPAIEEIDTLEFKDVGFKYQGSDRWALRRINCTFSKHEKIAIVGENGAGKTTFIKLICRLYDPSEGEILLNGVKLSEYNYQDYVKKVSAVFQDYQLFSIGLNENVSMQKSVDDSRIMKIFAGLGLDTIVNQLPNKLKNRVHKDFDQNGFEPSGGVGQKVAISRAVYKNAEIIILDEPTAALDPRAEYEIYQSFNQLAENKLSFYISHRLSSSRFCDRILVFKEGQIIEMGTHDELMRAHSVYYELYDMQSQYYIDNN